MNPTSRSFLYISIFVIVIGVLVTAVKAEPLHRGVCRDLREVSHNNCAMTFTTTVVTKAKAPAPVPARTTRKPKTSLPAKAEHEIPAPADTGAATAGGSTVHNDLRPAHLVIAVVDDE